MDGGIAAIIAGASVAALGLGGQMIAPEWLAAPLLAFGTLGLGAAVIVAYHEAKGASDKTRAPAIIPDLEASTADSVRHIMETDDGMGLVGLLQKGAVESWGRTKGYPNLRAIPQSFWQNDTLLFGEVDGKPMSYIGAPQRRAWRKGPENPLNARYYDIHFNKEQLQRYFPDRRF